MLLELFKRWLHYALVSFSIISFIAIYKISLFAKDVPGITKDIIKIGIILDQTGPAANAVVPTTQGVKCYFQNISEKGGINGRKIESLVEDDRYSVPLAITAFKKLVFRDKVFTLIAPTSSGALNALSRSVTRLKVPLLSPIMPEIAVKPFKRYVFTTADIYPNQNKVMVDYILKDLKPKNPKIALVYADTEAGKTDRDSAVENLKRWKLKPVCQEVVNPGSLEASSQVMGMKRRRATHIILCGQIPQPAIVLLREMKKFGVNIPVYADWAACVEEVIDTVGNAAKQFHGVNHMMSWYDDCPGAEEMRKVTLKYYPGTEKPYRGKIYTHGWVAASVMVEILKRSGKNFDREGFIRAMESIKNFRTGGLSGPISYSATSHKGGNTWKMFKSDVSSGKFIPITDWRKTD